MAEKKGAKKKKVARKAAPARKAGDFYPPIKAYNTGYLRVSEEHELYYEESGNPKGKPVVFLHGGPGGGTDPKMRRFFNPKRYRIVLFDQRGSGKSRPSAAKCCTARRIASGSSCRATWKHFAPGRPAFLRN